MLKDGINDYKTSNFDMNVAVSLDFKKIKLSIEFLLDNLQLLKDIKEEKLCYAIHIECPITTYRREFQTKEKKLDIEIPTSVIRSRLELHAFIIVAVSDYEYNNNDFDDFYKDYHMILHKGNILADRSYTYDFQDEYDDDELAKLPSIIKVVAVDAPLCTFDVDTANDDILIKLDRKMMSVYQMLGKGVLRQTFQALVLMPTIQIVLSRLSEASKNDFDEFESYHWFKIFSKLLKKNSIDIYELNLDGTDGNSVLCLMQKIMDDPLTKAFEELDRLNRGDGD